MVVPTAQYTKNTKTLSVLALSSRFDGPVMGIETIIVILVFQYSLCRVVLMVQARVGRRIIQKNFQYSLCRVVLMVALRLPQAPDFSRLSVLALSSRFDGRFIRYFRTYRDSLSVLALSSRFDGPKSCTVSISISTLSVLALSSRFDGPATQHHALYAHNTFQYSLCRVVLMVVATRLPDDPDRHFQYSLCRVVLMVPISGQRCCVRHLLSVLALSSRFDGQKLADALFYVTSAFSTRSVESF